MTTLGFIGVGNMGMGMLSRWRSLGHPALACDIDTKRMDQAKALGAQVLANPSELAKALSAATKADGQALLVVCVVDAAQCQDVLFDAKTGAAQAMSAGQTVLLTPTLSPNDVQSIAQQLGARGIELVDAPMSGGPARAALGTMSLMVAGPNRRQWWSVLEALAKPVFDIGDTLGDAAKTKLVNNLLAGMNLVASAQATHLAQSIGLDANRTWDVIEQSSGANWIGLDRMRRALAQDTSVKAHMRLLAKDTRLAMDMAQAAGLQPSMGKLAAALFAQAIDQAWADADDSAMLAMHKDLPAQGPL